MRDSTRLLRLEIEGLGVGLLGFWILVKDK